MRKIFLERILSGAGAGSFPFNSKTIKGVWIRMLLVAASLQPHLASAGNSCAASGASFPVVDLGPLTLPADTTVGPGPIGFPVKVAAGITCTYLDYIFPWFIPPVGISADLYSASGATWIFKTNLQGVGISVTALSSDEIALGYAPGEPVQFFRPTQGKAFSAVLNFEVQYYKLPGRVESGTVMAKNLFANLSLWGVGARNTVIPGLGLSSKSTTVKSGSCSAINSAQLVKLRRVSKSELSGGEAGRTPFNIHLTCGPGSVVKMTMTDVTRPSNVTERLTLGPDSTAIGVTLGIRNANGLVNFGPDSSAQGNLNQWLVAPSEGLSSIPFTVQYLANGNVTPGTVSGLVSFTLSYQ